MNNEDMSNILNKLNNIAGPDNNISPEMVNNLFNMINNSSNTDNQISNSSSNSSSYQNNKENNSSTNSQSNSFNTNGIDLETIMKMKTIIDKMNVKDDPRSNLLHSLKPYLNDSRKSKVDQYIQLMNMSKVMDVFPFMGGDKKQNG